LDQDKARLDPLTQLPNRTALVQGLLDAMAQAVRTGTPLSVMVLDIDFFKRINDSHGHLVGDRVIQSVAHTLQSQLRKGDLAARYGGEEFVLLLPHTHAAEALPLAQRLCDAVRLSPLQLSTGPRLEFTISVGVYTAQLQQPGPWEALVAAADAAMYEAKRNGRNQVVLAQVS
ncbi:MAG: GGDEF domain-containing protein, partial [Massilia sp.]